MSLRWTDDLCCQMVSIITDEPIIKQGLFPQPGTKLTDSNKLGKGEYRWMVADALFKDHLITEKHWPKIAESAARHKAWDGKVKNKLNG